MGKPKVVVAGPAVPVALSRLEQACTLTLWTEHSPIPRALLLDWLADAEGLWSNADVAVDAELLARAPKLRVVAQSSVGYDNVDIAACSAAGVPFGNTPGVLVRDHRRPGLGPAAGRGPAPARRLGAGALRPLAEHARHPASASICSARRWGIVGMGQIGGAVARRARASGMRILYNNRSRSQDEAELGATFAGFDDLRRRPTPSSSWSGEVAL